MYLSFLSSKSAFVLFCSLLLSQIKSLMDSLVSTDRESWKFTCIGTFGPVEQWLVQHFCMERKVAGSIPTIGNFHTAGPCKKGVFACLATDVNVK